MSFFHCNGLYEQSISGCPIKVVPTSQDSGLWTIRCHMFIHVAAISVYLGYLLQLSSFKTASGFCNNASQRGYMNLNEFSRATLTFCHGTLVVMGAPVIGLFALVRRQPAMMSKQEMLARDLRNFSSKYDDHQGDSIIQLIAHPKNEIGNQTCHKRT